MALLKNYCLEKFLSFIYLFLLMRMKKKKKRNLGWKGLKTKLEKKLLYDKI